MSQYNYTKGPDWTADAKYPRANVANMQFKSPMGWVQPGAGPAPRTTTGLVWALGVVTVTLANHGLKAGMGFIITGATPAGYNGYHEVVSVTDANTFTFALVANPGAATVQGSLFKTFEVVVTIPSLDLLP